MKHLLFYIGLILLAFSANGQLNSSAEELLSEYVQHESITGNEKNAAEFLLNKCKQAGLYTHVFTDDQNSFNFAASLYPLESKKPNIVFHNHCDVVSPGDPEKWTYPPFSGTIADSAVWGRGAIDNKALAVMELMALKQFVDSAKQADLPYNFTILTVSNEEKGGTLGAKRIIDEHLDMLNAAVVFGEGGTGTKKVLLSDPERTVFGISIAHKQAVWLQLSLKNKGAAHGAAGSDNNINKQMVEALYRILKKKRKLKITGSSQLMAKKLSKYEKGIVRCVYKHPKCFFPLIKKRLFSDPLLSIIFSNTMTPTRINSSCSSANSIADEIIAVLDCRFLEPTDANKFIKKLKRRMKSATIQVEVLGKTPSAKATVPDQYYSSLKQAIEQFDKSAAVVPILFPAVADNNYFRSAGIPTYGLLPCVLTTDDVSHIHNIDEKIPINCLYQGIDIYTNLIRNILKGK